MLKYLATVCTALLVIVVLGSAPASAHAALVSTDPGDGARLDTAPRSVTLTFSEDVATPAYIVITAPDGSPVETDAVEAVGTTVTAKVAAVDMKGDYSMSYRIVSSDGHSVNGSTTFEVATGQTVNEVAPSGESSFTSRHKAPLAWGLAAAVLAAGLLLWPLRHKRD